MKREVIFDMPNTYGEYRMVCRYGYSDIVYYAWWGHLQRQIVKKPLFWGKIKHIWVEVGKCWWASDINTMEQLKEKAAKFYDEHVELPKRLLKTAMTL